MKSHKVIGLCGILASVILLFTTIGFQASLSRGVLVLFVVLIMYLGILFWNYTINGDFKNSAIPALKVTLVLVGISLIIGLLKRFLS